MGLSGGEENVIFHYSEIYLKNEGEVNTGERIVEAYFRYCRGCLTIPDVKIPGGNNRQIDLLAWNPKDRVAYYVESSVVPSGRYFNRSGRWKNPFAIFQNKFFAQPKDRQIRSFVPPASDSEYQKVKQTYELFCFDPLSLHRVWECWNLSDYGISIQDVNAYFAERGIPTEQVAVVSFRDTIIPGLQGKVGSSNYEDDVLRTFSFFAERDDQHQIETSRAATACRGETT